MQPGDVIAGKYRVERLLGAGGMGSVYVAINEVLQKPVALKVMGESFATNAVSVQRFFREAMSASRVRHPAIVEIYDAGTHEGAPWMAMELLRGESLAQRLERGPLALGELGPVFMPVLSALHAVHAHGIVHRDLKPDNIFLEQLHDGGVQPKVLDFGIAKAAEGPSRLTATGTVMGTAFYLAPEQARDSSTVDPRSDLYAIGVVLYESITGGRMPYAASTLPELISKLLTEDPAPLLSVAPHVPAPVANVVHWCLARDPSGRPPSARELASHLQMALAGVPDQSIALAPSSPQPVRAATGSADGAGASALAAMSPAFHQVPSTSPGPRGTQPWSTPAPSVQPPPAFTSFPSFQPVQAPAKRSRATTWVMVTVLGLFALLVICGFGGVLLAPMLLRSAGGAQGAPMFSSAFPRMWQEWRAPILADANGDGARDVIGWSWQIINTDMHHLLCAYDGRTGDELWCADVGEQDDLQDTQTALAAGHLVYFDHRGRASAFALRGGAARDWEASVRGQPEEVCALGADRVGVRTADGLWSILTVATGAVALAGDGRPEGCAPAPNTDRQIGGNVRVSAPTWTRTRERWRSQTLSVRDAYVSSDSAQTLLMGVSRNEQRRPGMIALARGETITWEVIVPTDPIRAQAQAPEAVAITDEVVYVSYEMTARGDAPRHVAAFRMSDGHRLWDVGLPDARGPAAEYLMSDGELVVIGVSQILLGLDAATGQQRYQIGERSRSR